MVDITFNLHGIKSWKCLEYARERDERINPIRKVLNIPENIVPLNLISIGHPAEDKEPRTQYDKLRVHRGQW